MVTRRFCCMAWAPGVADGAEGVFEGGGKVRGGFVCGGEVDAGGA